MRRRCHMPWITLNHIGSCDQFREVQRAGFYPLSDLSFILQIFRKLLNPENKTEFLPHGRSKVEEIRHLINDNGLLPVVSQALQRCFGCDSYSIYQSKGCLKSCGILQNAEFTRRMTCWRQETFCSLPIVSFLDLFMTYSKYLAYPYLDCMHCLHYMFFGESSRYSVKWDETWYHKPSWFHDATQFEGSGDT